MLDQSLQQRIYQQLESATGHTGWQFRDAVIQAREADVYRLHCKGAKTDVAAKIYHPQMTSPARVLSLHHMLEKVYAAMRSHDGDLRVPAAYGCLADDGCLLMEFVDAPILDYRLWRYFYSQRIQQHDMRRSMAWLQQFHQCCDPVQQAVPVDYYPQHLEEYRQRHELGELAERAEFRQGLQAVRELSTEFSALSVGHARLHGDFTPTNLLLADQQVIGIDFSATQLMPVANDIALMINYIAISYPNMLTRSDMQLPPDQWPLLNILLDAYDYPKAPQQRRFLLYVLLYQTLRRWMVISQRNQQQRPTLLERWRLRNSAMIAAGVTQALTEP